jgi:prepilin-type N-terminal cleavage/methylation domain-containing protein
MNRYKSKSNQRGFTLIEMMAMLVILGVVASVLAKKYIVITDAAALRGIHVGIAELNARETLTWANHLFALDGFQGDDLVWDDMDSDLGHSYDWSDGPNNNGGTLLFSGQSKLVHRNKATGEVAAVWHF